MKMQLSLNGKVYTRVVPKSINVVGQTTIVTVYGEFVWIRVGQPLHVKVSFDGVQEIVKNNLNVESKAFDKQLNTTTLNLK